MSDANGYLPLLDDELAMPVEGFSKRRSVSRTAPPAPSSNSTRLISLDVLRGMTIFLMNLVNNSEPSYRILSHADWNGLTLADFVMPFFLFIVGVSIVLSHSRLKKRESKLSIFKKSGIRSLKLIGLGLLIPAIYGIPGIDIYNFRIPGVLQRIAIGYIVTVAIELFVPVFDIEEEGLEIGYVPPESGAVEGFFYKLSHGPLLVLVRYSLQWLCGILIFIIYLALALGIRVPGCGRGSLTASCNAFSYIDETIIRPQHLYQYPTCKESEPPCENFDPEGLLSTFMSVNSVIIGLYFGYVMLHFNKPKHILLQWLLPSTLFLFFGLIIHFFLGFPLNKNLYSPSFLFVLAGAAGYFLCLFYVVVDLYGLKLPFMPFIWLGSNSIIIYFLDQVTPAVIMWFFYKNKEDNIIGLARGFINKHLTVTHGSFFWGMSDAIFWTLVAGVLYYKKIFFKV